MIIYTNWMPDRFDGYNLGPITLIRPAFRNDKALHAHEEVHRQQFYLNPLMGLWYLFSKRARQAYEVEAYKAQLKLSPDSVLSLACSLANNYGLDVSVGDAINILSEGFNRD